MSARLAIVVDTFPRWSERFIARELAELRRQGVDFSVFCLKAGTSISGDDDEWAGLLERRIVLPARRLPRPFTQATHVVAALKRELGLSYHAQSGRAHALAEQLRTGGFSHVHAHFASLPSSLAWLAARETGVPFSFSVHARDLFLDAQCLPEKLADCVRVFACHSRAHAYLAAQAGAQGGKIVLMPHGLPLGEFPFRARSGPSTGRILAAGRFVPKKGFDALIEAARVGRWGERDLKLTLLGEGPDAAALSAQVQKAHLGKVIEIRPPAGGAELRRAFEESELFVAPYRTAPDGDSDGVPNVVLEALAVGLPVIGTRAGGLSEVLTEKTGTVISEGDPAGIAQAVAAVLDSPEAARRKAEAARQLVESRYDIRQNIAPLLELLRASQPAFGRKPGDR